MVNMVQIQQLLDDTLHTILEESPKPYIKGSTSNCPPFPPGFGRELFMVSHDMLLSMEKPVSSITSMKPGTLIANDVVMKKQKMPPKPPEVACRLSLVISNKSSSWWTTSKWSRHRAPI